jgi:sugar phosphate permease
MASYGWRMPFFAFGGIGLLWAAIWYWFYRDTPAEHAAVNRAERDLLLGSIGGGRASHVRKVPWGRILQSSTLWTLSLMYFCYAYCISVYLDWFPKYLHDHRGFDLKQMGFYASLPLLAGTGGDLAGGWLSDYWASRSGDLKTARRSVAVAGFLLAAGAILPATFTASPTVSVWYTCLAVFGLETTVGVSWAIPLDIGGDYAGSVSSVMNTCGNIGGAVSATVLGYLVQAYGWNIPFVVASALCLTAAVLFSGIDATRKIFVEERAAN